MTAFAAGFSGFWKRSEAEPVRPKVTKAPEDHTAMITVPRIDRVRMAFEDIPLNQNEHRAISALMESPGSTAQDFSSICGWMASGWRTQIMLLCQRRRRYLWPGGMARDMTNGLVIAALTVYDSDNLTFRARPELAAILQDALDNS